MSNQFTAGKWQLNKTPIEMTSQAGTKQQFTYIYSDNPEWDRGDPPTPAIAFIPHTLTGELPSQRIANARLIAAAPALYAVLRDIAGYVSPGDDVPFAAMIEDARLALATVEGA